jgi:hypothetical protein
MTTKPVPFVPSHKIAFKLLEILCVHSDISHETIKRSLGLDVDGPTEDLLVEVFPPNAEPNMIPAVSYRLTRRSDEKRSQICFGHCTVQKVEGITVVLRGCNPLTSYLDFRCLVPPGVHF